MAPELIVSGRATADGVTMYDNRIDVWALGKSYLNNLQSFVNIYCSKLQCEICLGITALELAEGQAPYEDMHPTRAIFQIVRNPPPTFKLPSKWSQNYADFISE